MAANGSRTPISLEELLAKRKQEQEESLRPRFMTKAERERLMEEERQRAEQRQTQVKRHAPSNSPEHDYDMDKASELVSQEERILLKEKFLGAKDNARDKRPRRFTEKKINFEWDASDDTSVSYPPIAVASQRNDGLGSSGRIRFDDRHWSEKTLTEMTDRDWRIFKEDYSISTSGGVVPHPIRYWGESALPRELVATILRLNYLDPTPIQRQAIPLALEGRDFIGVAETGSGKTASFIFPMIAEIMRLPKMTAEIAGDGPYGLILVPTRELANQIENEARKFLGPLGFQCFAIVGGHSIAEQSFQLRNGAEIIIATPGRMRDCLDQHVLVLNQCKYVVLDEADRMIDMNFGEDLGYILDTVPRTHDQSRAKYPMHMTMYSATMPAAVERLAKTYLMRPAAVTIGQTGNVADTIEQRVELIKEAEKSHRLVEILNGAEERFAPPVIVFVNQKKTVDYLAKRLETFGLRVVSLHGGKGQDQREAAINQLRTGQGDVLVATDVAGRGIDIKNVSLVVNYDMARSIEDYIHRVGRTGRAGNAGVAISFLTPDDADIFHDLRLLLQRSAKSDIPVELLQHEASKTQSRRSGSDRMIE